MDYEVKKLTKDQINLKDWEFEFQQRAEQPILLTDWFCRALINHFGHDINLKVENFDYIFTDSSKGYNNPTEKKSVLKELLAKTMDEVSLKAILESSITIPEKFNALADKTLPHLSSSTTNEELARYWEEMDQGFIKVIPWFWYPWYVSGENMLTNQVKMGLEKYKGEIEQITDIDEALMLIVFPIKKTGFQLEQEMMYELVKITEKDGNFSENSEFNEKALEYLKKYDWLTTFILSPLLPMTYEQLIGRVEEARKSNFTENFERQREKLIKDRERTRQIIELIKNDTKLIKLVDDSRGLGYVLTAGIEEAYVASSRYLRLLQMVAERIGVKFEDSKYLLSKEIVQTLKSDEIIEADLIESRKAGFIMMVRNGEQYVSFGSEGHDMSVWVDTEINKVDNTVRELVGQSASKGFVRGKVKIALTPAEAHTLKDGEILVCPMTNPDYVPAMKRSSAVVTDEGGMLSHAAIMSREFGKPCVMATKIATKLLKDGMEVEVDADHGIVRIIK